MGKSILFVCSGNTCRSVMAEYLLKHRAKEAGLELEVQSAGLHAFAGDEAAQNAVEALAELGITAEGHRSRRVQPWLLEQADLILAMTKSHKEELLRMAPEHAGKIFLLKEYAHLLSTGKEVADSVEKDYEIRDPYGQPLDVYRRSLEEIDSAVRVIVAQGKRKEAAE
ncbi:MAG: low molecular weight protein arginine phosphatase [Firmicutes bacterium]|nr:low molecular weight protein arginine phosphatase [Bacillota bacterium]